MNWWLEPVQQPNLDAKQQAEQHQLQLTKPTGALGDLEQIAITLASLQSNVHPQVNYPWITIFAGDHGVVEENISAYPKLLPVKCCKTSQLAVRQLVSLPNIIKLICK